MAVLGYSTKGASAAALGNGLSRKHASKFTLGSAATLTELHGWFRVGSGTKPLQLFIYADSAGSPSTRVAYTAPLNLSGTSGVDVELSQTGFSVALAAGDYWVGWVGSPVAFSGSALFDAGGTHVSLSTGAAYNPPADPFGSTDGSGTNKYSCWAVVTTTWNGSATVSLTDTVTTAGSAVSGLLIDNFNRADSANLGANWSQVPSIGTSARVNLNTNAARINGASAEAYTAATVPTGDFEVSAALGVIDTSSAHYWLLAQMPSAAMGSFTGYLIDVVLGPGTTETIWIYRGNAGSYTTVFGPVTNTHSAGQVIKVTKVGAVLRLYRNGIEDSSSPVTDPAPLSATGTYIGLGGSTTTTGSWDNFAGIVSSGITVSGSATVSETVTVSAQALAARMTLAPAVMGGLVLVSRGALGGLVLTPVGTPSGLTLTPR